MDLVSFLQTIRRHVGLVIIGVILTLAVTAGLVSHVQPTYITTGSVELVPPSPTADHTNPSMAITQSLESYALILSKIVNGPEMQNVMTKKGFKTDYTVSVEPVGTVFDVSTQAPTARGALRAYHQLLREIAAINIVHQRETSNGLPSDALINTHAILEPQTKPSTTAKTRVAVGTFALGLVATMAAVCLVDWRQRKRPEQLLQAPRKQKSLARPSEPALPAPNALPTPVIPDDWRKRKAKDDDAGDGPGLVANQ